MMRYIRPFLLGLVLGAGLALSGCGSDGDGLDERERIVAELAISGATIRFIDGKQDRALKVKVATAAVRDVLSTDEVVNVADLQEYLNSLVDTAAPNLNPYEVEAARAIVSLIMVDLQDVVPPTGTLDPETRKLVLRYAAAVERGADATVSAAQGTLA